MFRKFEQLEAEKRQKILNAALEEFALKGYEKASTNIITQQAGISKGILFHYFGNKEQLFLYLFHWALDYVIGRICREVDFTDRDVIVRLFTSLECKARIRMDYPTMFTFFQQAYGASPPQIVAKFDAHKNEIFASIFQKLFDNIDYSLFKDDFDPAYTLNSLRWMIEGYGNELIENMQRNSGELDVEAAFTKGREFIGYLKKLFYKEQKKIL